MNVNSLLRSIHQIPYDDISASTIWDHLKLCFSDPECLREMANVLKQDTELPCNIWLDFGKSYKKSGHFKRIKFQKDHGNRMNIHNFAEMKLTGEIIENTNIGSSLSKKEEKEISNFVINNYLALDLLSDSFIYERDFYKVMISGGEVASDTEKNIQKNELIEILKSYDESLNRIQKLIYNDKENH